LDSLLIKPKESERQANLKTGIGQPQNLYHASCLSKNQFILDSNGASLNLIGASSGRTKAPIPNRQCSSTGNPKGSQREE
jgi:hypothetical protein